MMSFDGKENPWRCVKGRTVHFQRVSSLFRDIGEPCLHQTPIKMSRMLKRDKWLATFDAEGKIFGFQKVLKLIVLGGVDPSIRPEVWEFLLGCYSVRSTAEYRRQLRAARRQRYSDLVKQCQVMHSSVGTGSLAYAVGSKVMDVRLSSKEDGMRSAEVRSGRISESSVDKIDDNCIFDSDCTDRSFRLRKKSSSDAGDHLSIQGSTAAACEAKEPDCVPQFYLDFPTLPVSDLFEESSKSDRKAHIVQHENKYSRLRKRRYANERMHSFQISNNEELVMESSWMSSDEITSADAARESLSRLSNLEYENELLNSLKISDAPSPPSKNTILPQGTSSSEDRVSEWLWTLHRIVVDVVRTDSHLEFYEDNKNLARMSDILAVYAWIDPATGYCQGMSDLLSPFVVLYEDDADAFWCFEMLLRKMRENFKVEGPTGVLKQLNALWHILEVTDREMFSHLSCIGAENLHFAFRMLLVLFRRELSFNEALRMWEMIWAADFDPSSSSSCHPGETCPEELSIELPRRGAPGCGLVEESNDSSSSHMGGLFSSKQDGACGGGECFVSENSETRPSSAAAVPPSTNEPFCGLTKSLRSKIDNFHLRKVATTGNGSSVDELPVFCVAAILFLNRQKIIGSTQSIDDLIKIFNDNVLKIRVKRCVRTAIKLRKKYIYKVTKTRNNNNNHVDVW